MERKKKKERRAQPFNIHHKIHHNSVDQVMGQRRRSNCILLRLNKRQTCQGQALPCCGFGLFIRLQLLQSSLGWPTTSTGLDTSVTAHFRRCQVCKMRTLTCDMSSKHRHRCVHSTGFVCFLPFSSCHSFASLCYGCGWLYTLH